MPLQLGNRDMQSVPKSPQGKRQLPIPDSKFLLMSMANMHNSGRIQVGPQPDASQPQPGVSAALEIMK